MNARADRIRQRAAAAGWMALLVPLAAVLLSAVLSPESNWTVRLALAGFLALAIARPAAALLVTAALIGVGTLLSHLAGVPTLRTPEVLVVASLAGCCVRALPRDSPFRRAMAGWISMPVALFAVAAATSAIVWLRVYQVETGYPSEYVQALLRFASRDYFIQPGNLWVVVAAAAILEGLALYVVFAALCELDARFFDRALRMLTVGGAALAMMSVVRLAEILLRNPQAIETLRMGAGGLRLSPLVPDLIAVGSYFALCWLAALGITIASPGRRAVWIAVNVTLIAGLYLTGSRSVIGAALVGLAAMVLLLVYQRAAAIRGVVVFAVAAATIMIVSFPVIIGRDVAGDLAKQSLIVRAELARTGLRVIATRPVFGVGLDRFHVMAGRLASPELHALWPERKNPHNDFLRFGAELGLVGLGLFLWILAAAGRRIRDGLRRARDARLAALAAGLAAFLVTSLVSNPLMVHQVSYLFWMALGLAVGSSVQRQAAPGSPEGVVPGPAVPGPGGRWRWAATLVIGAVFFLSIPPRARQEIAAVDLTRVSYGFFDWGAEPDGTPSRWTGRRATLFVDGRARLVEIPVTGTLPSGAPQDVEVRVDGRLANRIAVGSEWQRVRMLLPAGGSTGPRRIDLLVSPTWVPAEVMPGSQDRRVLGVKVGEIRVAS